MNMISLQRRRSADILHDFVECASQLLDSHDEMQRRWLEDRLLAMLPRLRSTRVFDVFHVRDPALRAMLADAGAPGLPDAPPPRSRRRASYQVY